MRRLALAALALALLGAGCGTHLVATKESVVLTLEHYGKKDWGPQRHHYECTQADREGRHYQCIAYGDPGTGQVVPMFGYDVVCDRESCQWSEEAIP
jgi:hypothetical protein